MKYSRKLKTFGQGNDPKSTPWVLRQIIYWLRATNVEGTVKFTSCLHTLDMRLTPSTVSRCCIVPNVFSQKSHSYNAPELYFWALTYPSSFVAVLLIDFSRTVEH